jgi:hypothetical protein
MITISDIFSNVTTTDSGTCWTYTATLDTDGAGVDSSSGEVARAVYEQASGPIPQGLVVRHAETCTTAHCVNPLHLRVRAPGSHIDRRERAGTTARGSKNGRAKLTEGDVREIRAAGLSATDHELAVRFEVDVRTVRGVLRRETWRHV